MANKTTVTKNPSGLHLRPAGVLYKEALRYRSKTSFKVYTTTASAESVLGILEVCAKLGDEIEFVCEGPNEKEVLGTTIGIVEAGLGE